MKCSKWVRPLMWIDLILALASMILYFVDPFAFLESPQRSIYNRYLFLPFFFCFCLTIGILAWTQWKMPRPMDWSQIKWIFRSRILCLILAGIGIVVFLYRVLIPVIEIPYLFSPQTIDLDHVEWTSDIETMTFSISGIDPQGNTQSFALNPLFFAESNPDTLQLQYLPFSQTVINIQPK